MFESLKARLDRLFAEHTPPADARARGALLHEAVVEAKVGLGRLRDGVAATERELAQERGHLADAERRGRLAAEIGDEETVTVAQRFAERHRERAGVLDRKLAAQREELALAEREVAEMTAQLRARPAAQADRSLEAAWRDLEAAGGARPGTDAADDLLRAEADAAARQAAVEAQLAALKKKLGRD